MTGPTQNCQVFVPQSRGVGASHCSGSIDIVQIHGMFDEALIPRISVPSFVRSSSEIRKQECQARQIICSLMLSSWDGQTHGGTLLKDQRKIQQDFFIAGELDSGQCPPSSRDLSALCLGCLFRGRNGRTQRYRKEIKAFRKERKHELSTTG